MRQVSIQFRLLKKFCKAENSQIRKKKTKKRRYFKWFLGVSYLHQAGSNLCEVGRYLTSHQASWARPGSLKSAQRTSFKFLLCKIFIKLQKDIS